MGKYYLDKPETVRVNGGGQYSEEWFDLKTQIAYDVVMEMGTTDSSAGEKAKLLAYSLIVAHSLTKSDGEPLDLTKEAFGALPFALIQPVIAYVNNEDFLAQLSAQKNPEK